MFIGDMICAANKDALKHVSVSNVLNVAVDLKAPFPQDFDHLLLPMLDMEEEDLLHYVNLALRYVDRAFTTNSNAVIFVHCRFVIVLVLVVCVC
jgi:hypothetical protein